MQNRDDKGNPFLLVTNIMFASILLILITSVLMGF